MDRVRNINFTLNFPNGFVAECKANVSSITTFDIFEFLKLPYATIYEEHILCGKLNYIGQLVHKETNLFVEGEVVEINGIYYILTDKDTSNFQSQGIIVFTFSSFKYDSSIYHRVYSNNILRIALTQVENDLKQQGIERGTYQYSKEEHRRMKEFARNCVIFRIEAYDEESDSIKTYGFNFYELELARKVASSYSFMDIYLFEEVTNWSKEEFVKEGILEQHINLWHGYYFRFTS